LGGRINGFPRHGERLVAKPSPALTARGNAARKDRQYPRAKPIRPRRRPATEPAFAQILGK
jgi:hypothetical protein